MGISNVLTGELSLLEEDGTKYQCVVCMSLSKIMARIETQLGWQGGHGGYRGYSGHGGHGQTATNFIQQEVMGWGRWLP